MSIATFGPSLLLVYTFYVSEGGTHGFDNWNNCECNKRGVVYVLASLLLILGL